MAWCQQAISHYLSQCWPRSTAPYGATIVIFLLSVSESFVRNIFPMHIFFLISRQRPIFYLWLNKVSANGRKCYICEVFSHWPIPCCAIERRRAKEVDLINSLKPGDPYLYQETGLRLWLGTCSVPSHYLNQYWLIVNWTPRNKLQWNLNKNTNVFLSRKRFWQCHLLHGQPFVQASMC